MSIPLRRVPLRQHHQVHQPAGELEFPDKKEQWRGGFLTSHRPNRSLYPSTRPALKPAVSEVSSDSEFPPSSASLCWNCRESSHCWDLRRAPRKVWYFATDAACRKLTNPIALRVQKTAKRVAHYHQRLPIVRLAVVPEYGRDCTN